MRTSLFAASMVLGAFLLGGCKGGGKLEIPLTAGQTYIVQASGKMRVYPSANAEGASGSRPLQKLQVKRKNEGAQANTPGCWACTDCVCSGAECSCSECTSC